MFKSRLQNQQALLESALRSENLIILARFKLAFVIGKHKMPFSSCPAFLGFAKCADPNSVIFSRMSASRDTITKTHPAAASKSTKAFCCAWCIEVVLIADESLDSATQDQLSLCVRYINLEEQKIEEQFLEMKRVIGHLNATNIFSAVMKAIIKDDVHDSFPTEKLVGLPKMVHQS